MLHGQILGDSAEQRVGAGLAGRPRLVLDQPHQHLRLGATGPIEEVTHSMECRLTADDSVRGQRERHGSAGDGDGRLL